MSKKSGFAKTTVLPLVLLASGLVPLAIAATVPAVAFAQAAPTANSVDEVAAMAAARDEALAKLAALKPTTGTIALNKAKATLTVPAGYGMLNPEQSRVLLTEIWSNPPEEAEGVLGIIVKYDGKAIDDTWATVITFDDSGYVTDSDASDINAEKLLSDEQSGEADLNSQRTEAGYDTVHLAGWAEPPRYDAASKRIYWAKRLKFSSSETESLNYSIRVLGRRGYLSMNFVAAIEDLEKVKTAAPDVLKMADFNAGERYADYKQGDKASGLGLAGLVAGAAAVGVAKKVGLLGLILAFGKKGIVILLALFAGLFGKIKSFFGKKREDDVVGEFSGTHPEDTPYPSDMAQSEMAQSEMGQSEAASTEIDAMTSAPQNPPSNSV
jgi:uncharacterized membrane-anchored protein